MIKLRNIVIKIVNKMVIIFRQAFFNSIKNSTIQLSNYFD